MVKIAVYCPRLPKESEGAWQMRMQACRLYIRKVKHVDALEFESLEHLQINYRRHSFRRVLVARSGYYALDFWSWARHEHIHILDVLLKSNREDEDSSLEFTASGRRLRNQPLFYR